MAQDRITESTTPGNGPTIRDTSVPVHQVLALAAGGLSPDGIVKELPDLELADVRAAMDYAIRLVCSQNVPAATAEVPDTGEAGLDLGRILVVDDREGSRRLLELMLEGSGFSISLASDGEEALEKAQAEHPFLVLSDVQMPRMDGLDLCRRLKDDERTRDGAVVLITTFSSDSSQISEGLEMGADDYVSYPIEEKELLARVRAVARLKRAEEDARRQARVAARRNKELEVLNSLALAVSSTLELGEIFVSSMHELCQLLDAEAVSLLLLNREAQELLVNIASRRGRHLSQSVEFRTQAETAAWVVQERVPAIVSGILCDPQVDFEADLSPTPNEVRCIPMISQERIIGAVAIVKARDGYFSASDWTMLYSAASVVAVAVENGRLLQSAQQQVQDLILLNEIGRMLTSTLDPDEVLTRTTQLVQELLQAGVTSLWLLDDETNELVLTTSSGADEDLDPDTRIPATGGIVGQVVDTGEPYLHEPGSLLCAPLRVKGQIIGVLQALPRLPRWFDKNDLYVLNSIASSVGIAAENARLFGEMQDFTHRLEQMVEERTRELVGEKQKTEAILASMADGLLVLDAENHVMATNAVAEGMLGFRLDELRGKPVDAERLKDPLWRCVVDMASGEELIASASVDVPASAGSDDRLSIQAHSARVRDEEGDILGTVVLLRDITPIREVERMKARFMAGVTHELKTPLSIIRLRADNLGDYWDRLSKSKREDLIDSICIQTKLLERLVERILELSRLESGLGAERELVDLVDLTDRMVTDMRPLAENKQVDLRWIRPRRRVVALATRGQMRQVVHNLLENAVKYTPERGFIEIKVGAGAVDGRPVARLEVSDTGIGIPAAHQARVFERFYRIDPSHNIPGTGLGLSIVKEIVETYGGEIELKSAPGEGSTFTVTLPGVER